MKFYTFTSKPNINLKNNRNKIIFLYLKRKIYDFDKRK